MNTNSKAVDTTSTYQAWRARLDAMDPTREGITERDLRNRLSPPQRKVMGDALTDLYKGGKIDRRDGPQGGDIYSLSVA